jgi:hypothetical protein
VKKIGNDSVVIMTTEQGRKINELFDQNDKEILKLKDSVDSLKIKYVFSTKIIDSLKIIRDTIKFKSDSIKYKNDSLFKLYSDMKFRRDTNLIIYRNAEIKWNKSTKLWGKINIAYFIVMVTFITFVKSHP